MGTASIGSADVETRLSAGNQGAGPDWSAQARQSIDAARAALARLDRGFAQSVARTVADDIVHRGGGAGGADILVEWCLLERQLALTASNPAGANEWLATAVALGPDVEVDPLRHPEEERDLFARMRVQKRAESPSVLTIATTPSAEIWVDGVRRCESPCTVTLVPGRHLARASSPAHASAIVDLELGPGASTTRTLSLSAAYAGASATAIAALLSNPSRQAEGASALEPMARFLDVEHVIAVLPDGDDLRILVAPPAAGRLRTLSKTRRAGLSDFVAEQLRPIAVPASPPPTSWYAKPGTWIIGGGVVVGVVAGLLIYNASRDSKTGTLTVTSP